MINVLGSRCLVCKSEIPISRIKWKKKVVSCSPKCSRIVHTVKGNSRLRREYYG